MADGGPDVLDKTVTFLAKRDGIDKVLKITRYVSKLLLATTYKESTSEAAIRLKDFETSIGVSRKAYRLGKFLADINSLRKSNAQPHLYWLEVLANGGEGCYYFLEQLTWLIKAGMLNKRYQHRVTKLSAWSEMTGYMGNIILSSLFIRASLAREKALQVDLDTRKKHDEECLPEEGVIRAQLKQLQSKRVMKSLALIQDLSDSTLALNDITDGKGIIAHPVWLATAGLISAAVSVHKNWP
ncbi:hypothetical protein WJX84_004510 [Apatococcus fuscideae]|uniref:Peroxisomal membrane protein 11A n=1 Tax=Apatococcus fuscideae TaxID=2026836 RepID=A0AAW1TGJ7_9CHLO